MARRADDAHLGRTLLPPKMHFDLADLQLFIHVAESSSLTKASRRAHLSLPSVSSRIKALEGQLESVLLYRTRSGVELTPSGHRLYDHARAIMRNVDALKGDFSAGGIDATGRIRIFANTTAVNGFMPEILAPFLAERPAIVVDMQERNTRDTVRAVAEGSIDLGITAGPVATQGLERIPFYTDRLVLGVPVGHELAQRQDISILDSLAYPHISLHDNSTLLTFLRDQIEASGRAFALRIQVPGFESVCRLIEGGAGVSVVPESTARRYQRSMALKLVPLQEPWAVRQRDMLVRDLQALPTYIRALVDAVAAYKDF